MKALVETGLIRGMVTHDMAFARKVADRVLFLDGGYLVENAPPDVVFTSPKSDRARQLLEKML